MRKSLSNSIRKQPEPPSQQKRQLKHSFSPCNHNESALSNFWELPKAVVVNTSSRVQSIIAISSPKETTTRGGRGRFIRYPNNLSERQTAASVSVTAGSAKKRSQSQVVIESSDGSQEIKCLTELAKARRLAPTASTNPTVHPEPLTVESEPPTKRQLQKLPNVLEGVEVDSSDDDFVKEISKKPNANAIYPQAVDNGITNKPIDLATSFGDDDVQVLPTEDSRAECVSVRAPEHARISPPKGQHFLPSSPPLLRANSPTIRRFNSGGSQLVVLANETQDADNDSLSVSPSAPVTDILSGNTLASGCMANTPLLYNGGADSASTLVHTHSAGNAITNIYYPLPGSLPPSRGTASMGPCSEPKDNSAELSSDPISEFLTPTAPPKNSQVAPSFSELAKMAEPIGSVPLFSDTQDSREPESDMEEDNRSITQWYKENLFTQRLDDGGGRNDDDDPLSDVLNNSILDTESGSETEMCKELNQPNRSSVATGVSASSGKHPGNQNKDDSDDGYSSPLEGFWDLRRSAQGSIFDRDMYINQFEPSQRQPVSRKKRKDTQRNIVQSNFYDRSSTPKARAGTSTLGSQGNIPYNVKCSTAPANLRGKGAIRPLVSSRLPRPAANRPAAAKSAANPPGYNHYADDPHLDIIGSMGWEGGGMSRFG